MNGIVLKNINLQQKDDIKIIDFGQALEVGEQDSIELTRPVVRCHHLCHQLCHHYCNHDCCDLPITDMKSRFISGDDRVHGARGHELQISVHEN